MRAFKGTGIFFLILPMLFAFLAGAGQTQAANCHNSCWYSSRTDHWSWYSQSGWDYSYKRGQADFGWNGRSLILKLNTNSLSASKLFLGSVRSDNISRIGVRYFYTDGKAPWTALETVPYTGTGYTVIDLYKYRPDLIRLNFVIIDKQNVEHYADIGYWNATFNGSQLTSSGGAFEFGL